MLQIPTPPASRPGSEAPEVAPKPNEGASSELLQSLDTLLEQYLHLLDRQQQLQSGISKQLSSGFLAIAHANYTCPPGRRYGSDYYDERMKATRKISIQPRETSEDDQAPHSQREADSFCPNDFEYDLSLQRVSNHEPDEQPHTTEEAAQPSGLSSENAAPESDDTLATTSTNEHPPDSLDAKKDSNIDSSRPTKAVRKKFRSEDPVHWYGILVPSSLRTAQRSFTDAIQGPIPELAGTVIEMRSLELRIAQVRNKLEGQATTVGS